MKQLMTTAAMALGLAACSTTMSDGGEALVSRAPPHAPIVGTAAVPVVPHPDQLALLESDDPQLEANKRLVFDFWRGFMNAGHLELADEMLAEDFIQHNPTAPTGRAAMKAYIAAVQPRQAEVPALIEDPLVTLVAEGDLVLAAFMIERPEPDGSGETYTSTEFHLFRIADGIIVEHWDTDQLAPGMDVPAPEDGGPVPIVGARTTEEQLALVLAGDPANVPNKRTVFDLWRHVPDAGREELTDLYLDPIYIQHNPNAETGSAGFRAYMSRRPELPIETHYEHPLVAMIAEGDLVAQVLADQREHPDKPGEMYTIAWIDLFRLENGKIVEHWDPAAKGELRAGTLPEE